MQLTLYCHGRHQFFSFAVNIADESVHERLLPLDRVTSPLASGVTAHNTLTR